MKIKGFKVNLFSWTAAFCLLLSCHQNTSKYPPTIERAIDLFFMENKNNSVLNILKNDSVLANSENLNQIRDIFMAAALAESSRPDSAKIILLNVDSTDLNERDKYYYKTIEALVEFRLNNLQEFTKIATSLQTAEIKDIRCLAMIQRLMARTMYYYENFEIAITLMLSSSELYREAKLEKSEAINKKFLASYYSRLESYDLAIDNLNEAEITFKEYNDLEELYYVYIIGLKTYILLNQTDMARKYANLALTATSGVLNNQKLASIYNYIGNIEKLDSNYNEAIKMFESVIKLDKDYFGADTREIEGLVSLASIYNLIGDFDKALENALMALDNIKDIENSYLKYEVYKELSAAYYDTDPQLAYSYLDSAIINHKKYQELSSIRIADFVNTHQALIVANDQILKLKEIKNRNRIITLLIVTVLFVTISAHFLVNYINRKNKASTDLIKKNLMRLWYKNKSELAEDNQDKESCEEQKETMLYNRFISWLENYKIFLDPDLDLNLAAREIGTNRSYLSRSINQQGIGFSEIINRYRIREIIKIFEDETDERNSHTLSVIAAAVGFKTKSVFYDSFRKETGMTPNQFRENIQVLKNK